jgi:hypothetical protein
MQRMADLRWQLCTDKYGVTDFCEHGNIAVGIAHRRDFRKLDT